MTANDTTKPNNTQTEPTPRIYRLVDLIGEFTADVTRKFEAKAAGRKLGPSTGHEKLDGIIGEYFVNGLHLIQGAPGAGKSAFSLQMAGKCGFPCLYVSTEMPVIELLRRTIARETQTYLGKLKTGELGAKESERLAMEAAKQCPDIAFVDALSVCITPAQIVELAGGLRDATGADQVLIILDSAQAWVRQRMTNSGRDEYNETGAVIGDLLKIAVTIKSAVIAISHKNREGNKGNSKDAHSAKGSGAWEYMIETGIDLSLDEDAEKDENNESTVWASIWKNRNGEPNVKFPLKFNGGFQSFREGERKKRAAAASTSRTPAKAAGKGKGDDFYRTFDDGDSTPLRVGAGNGKAGKMTKAEETAYYAIFDHSGERPSGRDEQDTLDAIAD